MAQLLFRAVFLWAVRFFYRAWGVSHAERVPARGPCLVAANHPNGLIDPLVVRVAIQRPVAFLGKNTLFGNPFGRLATGAFNAIPVYRQKDGENTGRNEETFERCRALFRAGGWLAIFPEGTSHSDPSLKPMKTGAARIALSAEAQAGWTLGLTVLPVGLLFDDKDVFRSNVAVAVAEPIRVSDFRVQHDADEWAAVEALTARVGAALGTVTLQADTPELWEGFRAVASWVQPAGTVDPAAVAARAQQLADAYRALRTADPDRADALVARTRRFVNVLSALGVNDPWSLEDARAPGLWDLVKGLFPILTLWPLALVGAVLNGAVYKAIKPLAVHLSHGEEDVVSTIKLMAGVVFMPLCWLFWGAVGLAWGGWPLALGLLVLAPTSGFVALRFDERLSLRRELLRTFWLRVTRARVVDAVNRRRRELAAELEAALVSPT